MDRRALLRAMALVATGGLAGCGGGGEETPTEPATDSPIPSPTASPTASPTTTELPTATPIATDTPTPTSTPTATSTPTPIATDTPVPTATPTATSTPTPTETATPAPADAAVTVEVAPGGQFVFSPESFEIAAGETVRWVWRGGGHNVKPTATPSGSDWSGTPGDGSETFGSGYDYTYTFEATGTYEYHCVPHSSLGMEGSFTVG